MADNSPVLITGASSGIGAALASVFADRGRNLVLVARRTDRLEEVAKAAHQHHVAVETLTADLATIDGLATVVERAGRGDIDVLVSNAGVSGYSALTDLSGDDVDTLWRLNATAPVALTHAALPAMTTRSSGSIVTIASLLAFATGPDALPAPLRTIYSGAKAATVAFTRRLAAELADTGVSTTVVCPGRVATDWSGGANREHGDAMSAHDVAQAAVVAMERCQRVCIPGLSDTAAWAEFERAELAVFQKGNYAMLSPEYDDVEPLVTRV